MQVFGEIRRHPVCGLKLLSYQPCSTKNGRHQCHQPVARKLEDMVENLFVPFFISCGQPPDFDPQPCDLGSPSWMPLGTRSGQVFSSKPPPLWLRFRRRVDELFGTKRERREPLNELVVRPEKHGSSHLVRPLTGARPGRSVAGGERL